MKHFLLHIFLLLLVFGVVGCTGDISDVPADSGAETPAAHRDSVALSFEAILASPASPASRAEFGYGDLGGGSKGLALSWSENDVLGVYIKTTDGKILRAGNIVGKGAKGDESRNFSGVVLQKFEGEHYIYMHPDLGRKTYINLEEQEGALASTEHLGDYLPIVWDTSKSSANTGTNLGYVLHLVLDFQTTNPGLIRKVSLVTENRGDEDRIFPRHYSINQLDTSDADAAFDANEAKSGTAVVDGTHTSNADFTNTISLDVTSGYATKEVRDGKTYYSTDLFLTSSQVQNLNVYETKFYVRVLGERGATFQSQKVSFKGQSSASGGTLYSHDVLKNRTVGKMVAVMSEGTISPTIISNEYKINSILGMWNEYGKSYDPNGLVFYKSGFSGVNSGIPQVLIQHGNAIHDRYILTNSNTGTPTFTWNLYESQNNTYPDGNKQADAICNNITITKPTEIFVSFLSEYAWNQNLLGYYHYPTSSVPESSLAVTKNIIFPNISKPGHEPFNSLGLAKNNIGKNEDAPLEEYMTVKLIYTNEDGVSSTTFPAGTTIGFWGMIDVQANGFQQSKYSLLRWDQWRFFTNSKWNGDKLPGGSLSNSGWTGNYARCNFFASGDICNRTTDSTAQVDDNEIIKGIAIYGFKDNVTNEQNTAFSTCIFLVSASDPEAMQTSNKACFNIGCPTKPYPTNNIVLTKK